MNRVFRWLSVVSVVLVLCLGLTAVCYRGEYAMGERIMMQHRYANDEEVFDATRWFESGMYRHRRISRNRTMLRVEIPPFSVGQLENLRVRMTTALDPTVDYYHRHGGAMPKVPESYKRILMDEGFDPRTQIFYKYSYFPEPDKPMDMYVVGFLLEGERFAVNLARAPFSGEIVGANRDIGMGIGSADKHVFYREMEKRQKRMQGKTGNPERPLSFVPPGVQGNMACPQTGWWWTPEPLGRRHFTKGEIMPMLTPDDDTNIWLWSEKQTP
jgi:hypothetical protein